MLSSLKKSFLIIVGGGALLLGVSAFNPYPPPGRPQKFHFGRLSSREELTRKVGYFLSNSVQTIETHVENLNNINSSGHIPEDTYKIAPRVEIELNGIVKDLEGLLKNLQNPSSAGMPSPSRKFARFHSNFISLDNIAQDVIEILKALRSSYQVSLGFADHDTTFVSEKALAQVSKAMGDVLNVLIKNLHFNIAGTIFSDRQLDIESFSKLNFGFGAIVTILKESST